MLAMPTAHHARHRVSHKGVLRKFLPKRKVTAGALGAALALLAGITLKKVLGWDLGAEGGSALSTVFSFAAGYLTPEA